MVAPFLDAYSHPETALVWSVENAAGTIGGEPAGWEDPDFDDAAWDPAYDAGDSPFFFGATWNSTFGPASSPSKYVSTEAAQQPGILTENARDLTWLVRMTFYLPSAPTVADLVIDLEDNDVIWKVNGVQVITTGVRPETASVDTSSFVVGLNVLTAHIVNGDSPISWEGGNPTGVCARLYTDVEATSGIPPVPGVWMDWDRDGFTTTGGSEIEALLPREMPQPAASGLSDNVTARTLSVTWHHGGSYDHQGQDGPGGATIVLNNFDGLFDPDNTASPLYGKLVPGIPVWVGVIEDTWALSGAGTVAGVVGQYVKTWSPTLDESGKRVVEVVCEDALGLYADTPVSVEPSLLRSQGALREAVLIAAGESITRLTVESEPGMLPISAVDNASALSVLEELNRATASRHFVKPADTKEDWYRYVVVNKFHGLADAVAETINGDDIHDVSGWVVTNENLIEQQRASVEPITITANNNEVWNSDQVPIVVTNVAPRTIWAEFSDYVFNAAIDTNVPSGAISTVLTNFGKTAKIEIWATTASATIGRLAVLGQLVVRGDSEQVIAGSTAAGVHAGSTISSDYIGGIAAAQGLCDFLVWKFGQRLKRPSFTMVRKSAATAITMANRDLYDVIGIVVDKLSVTTRRLEIVGLDGSLDPARNVTINYRTQETANQAAVHYFTVDTDTVDSAVPIAPF